MIGVGVDIIEIDRIAKAISRGKFLERSFTDTEIKYFCEKGRKAEVLSGIFAAKEAVAKAMGTGFREFKLIDIEIIHSELGEPVVALGERAMEVAKSRNISDFKLSISHNQSSAIAFAVAF
ncbi:MAG: holo-ACP synthase [Filifactoraceae bacterium]